MFSFKPYKRKLKTPLKMSRGVIDHREGVILRLESDKLAFSEVLVMDYYETESLVDSLKVLKSLPRNPKIEDLQIIPENYSSTRFAFEALFFAPKIDREMKVSKLLPAGRAAIEELKIGLTQGFETFKWKIGLDSSELDIFDEILEIGAKAKFRLDANAGLDLKTAEKWLERCEDSPVEFIEQPLGVELFADMLELSKKYKTLIALDESVAKFDDILIAESKGWNGIYIVKPLRLGKLNEFLKWRANKQAQIVYSSALETIFGLSVSLNIALSDLNNNFELGFGVSNYFEEDGLGFAIQNKITAKELGLLSGVWDKISGK